MKPNHDKQQKINPKQSQINQISTNKLNFQDQEFSEVYSVMSSSFDKKNIGQNKIHRNIQIINRLVTDAINELKKQQYDSQESMINSKNHQKSQQGSVSLNQNTGHSHNSPSTSTSVNNAHLSNVPSLSYIKRISLNLEQSRTQQILQQLRKGYLVRKHSSGTSQPHDKYVYLSQDHRFFCWKSIDKNDQKSIELRKITNVVKGLEYADSKTMKALKNTEKAKNCLVVLSQVRNLQIQTFSNDVVETLYEGFIEMMKNSKRMHLSYQF